MEDINPINIGLQCYETTPWEELNNLSQDRDRVTNVMRLETSTVEELNEFTETVKELQLPKSIGSKVIEEVVRGEGTKEELNDSGYLSTSEIFTVNINSTISEPQHLTNEYRCYWVGLRGRP